MHYIFTNLTLMVVNGDISGSCELILESSEIIGGHTKFLVTTWTEHNYITANLLSINYWPCDAELVTLFGNQYYVIGGIIIDVQGHETYFQVIESTDTILENIHLAIIGKKTGRKCRLGSSLCNSSTRCYFQRIKKKGGYKHFCNFKT